MSAPVIFPRIEPTRLHLTVPGAVKPLDASKQQVHRRQRGFATTGRRARAHPGFTHPMSRLAGFLDNALARTRRICWPLGACGLIVGAYLTLRPSGNLKSVWWIPSALGHWCDQHGQLRNLPAFFLLALPSLIALRRPGQRLLAMASLAVFGAAVELAQLALPGRWFEWEDIALTWAGLALAYGFSAASRAFLRSLRSLSTQIIRQHRPATTAPWTTEAGSAAANARPLPASDGL